MTQYKDESQAFFNRVKAELEKFVMHVNLKLVRDSVAELDRGKANATGQLRKNIGQEILHEAGKIIGVVGVNSNVKYGIYRHEGTRPHFPPVAEIRKWVIQKGLLRGSRSGGVLRSSGVRRSKAKTDEADRIAFLIARKISKRGTAGLPFLRLALKQNESWIANELSKVNIA